MGVGSIVLLAAGIIIQGLPPISTQNLLYLLWLAAINTALAFVIWNYTLKILTALESSNKWNYVNTNCGTCVDISWRGDIITGNNWDGNCSGWYFFGTIESEGKNNMKDYKLKNFLTEYIILRNLRYVKCVT